jgi:3-oxoacyl-[acyl-carrier protein] reductase
MTPKEEIMVSIDLAGKVALITGGSRGIGAATACRLAEAGATVIVGHFPSDECRSEGEKLVAEISASHGCAFAFPLDVTELDSVTALICQVMERWGHLDILVNNAGILRDRTLKKMDLSEWESVINTNLTGVWKSCRAAAEVMADGGRIVSIASISAQVGFFGQSNYAAAKAGVIGLTRVLSKELASRQITVNAVAPGVILTAMAEQIPEAVRNQMLPQIPLGRFGSPEEVANAILFLCAPLSDYITGQVLNVNGGWYCG